MFIPSVFSIDSAHFFYVQLGPYLIYLGSFLFSLIHTSVRRLVSWLLVGYAFCVLLLLLLPAIDSSHLHHSSGRKGTLKSSILNNSFARDCDIKV